MIRGYISRADHSLEPLASIEAVAAGAADETAILWVDVESEDTQAVKAVGAALGLAEEAVVDSVEGEQRPRIDEYEDHVFVVLYGAVGPEATDIYRPRKLSCFLSARYLVTVHQEPLRTISGQLKRLERRPDHPLHKGLDELFYNVVDSVVDNYGLVVEGFADRLEKLEERSLHAKDEDNLLSDLMDVRRELLDLRRMVAAQRELVMPIASGELDYISRALEPRFSHVRDHLTTTLELIDSHREILHGIRENYNLWLSNRLNEVMKVLTIFASLFLPMSLIAGIYGMNTPLWPPPDDPLTFWGILASMAVVAGGMIVYFWRKRWL